MYAECKKSRRIFFFVNKKASLDVLCYPSRTMYCMGPSPHSNVCDCRSILATIPHLRSLLQVSHDPNPRKKTPAEQYWRFPGAAKMLQLAKDLEIFHLTRHVKERKGRSSTSFSPPFELFLRQHRSSAVPRRLSPFFVAMALLWHQTWWLYHGSRHASLDPACFFFCLTLLADVVDERRTVDLFSHFCHIVDDGNHRSTCTSGLFGLCLCIGGFAVDFLSALRPADIACEPGKFLCKLLLQVYDRPLPISVSDRSHPAFVEALSYFLTEKVPLHWIYFLLSNCRSPTETGLSGRSSLPTQWRRWPADKMHQASTLERGLVMVYLRSTLKKTHWLGHWTSRSQGGKNKQFDHISIDGDAPFFFYVSRATSDPARQWCTVPHVAKLNVISPNGHQPPLATMKTGTNHHWPPWRQAPTTTGHHEDRHQPPLATMKTGTNHHWPPWRQAPTTTGHHEDRHQPPLATMKTGTNHHWPPWRQAPTTTGHHEDRHQPPLATMKTGTNHHWPPWRQAPTTTGHHEDRHQPPLATMKTGTNHHWPPLRIILQYGTV